ncbi:histidine kinase dimerization/phospho-acceptor domain-containing protein [Rhizorhapis sp. SPR117]|uniref:histidine kinase dimerization/phospho-acceptor domain-containing protein n=1 Tax=Rhizorhapis sp. SPR117 TaxID=2912611 RepID=UPI0030C80E24
MTRWRQCVDLLAQFDRPSGDAIAPADRESLIHILESMRDQISERQRISTVVDLGSRLRSPRLIRFFAADRSAICAAAMARAELPDASWAELIGELSPTARGILRHRRDLGPLARRAIDSFGAHDLVLTNRMAANANEGSPQSETPLQAISEPQEEESQIRRLVDRIESFTSGRGLRAPVAETRKELDAAVGEATEHEIREFSFETNMDGVIHWVKDAPRAQLIGLSISQPPPFANAGPDGHVAGAFRHRTAFRNARFTIESGRLAGEWRMSAIPYFDQQTGRFQGYRGNVRRPHLHEVSATTGRSGGLYGSSVPGESLRELIHELRTPLNAILGFAEIIDHQFFGPVSGQYRTLASNIVTDAQQLLGTFDDLDLASRIERGDLESRPGFVDAADLLLGLAARFSDNGAAARLSIETGDELPPLGLEAVQAERMFQHLLRAVLSVSGPGEPVQGHCSYDHSSRAIVFALDRPIALRGMAEADMFDPAYGPDGEWPDAPLLGIGFSLRLVQNLARGGGGQFVIENDRFILTLPAMVEAEESGTGA